MRMRKPSPGVAIALVALFFALGGTAVAAKHYLITSTKQIKPSVLKALKGNRGPAGPKGAGATGATGATGPTGATGATGKEGPPGKEGEEGPRGEAGPVGQGRAFATIKPGAPAEVKPGSRGVIGATTFSGITCVFLEPSIELSKISPVVTNVLGDVTYSADPGGCFTEGKSGVQVNGFNQDGSGNSTSTFNIIVP